MPDSLIQIPNKGDLEALANLLVNLDLVTLEQALVDVRAEIERKRIIETSEQQVNIIIEQYSKAIGRTTGSDWVQPTGAHDAYLQGAVVTHKGKTWVSTTSSNVWEPGVSGWQVQAAPDPDTGEPGVPDWVQPTGAHDAYKKGDQVVFNGAVYESLIDGNVWSPSAYPQGWKSVS